MFGATNKMVDFLMGVSALRSLDAADNGSLAMSFCLVAFALLLLQSETPNLLPDYRVSLSQVHLGSFFCPLCTDCFPVPFENSRYYLEDLT